MWIEITIASVCFAVAAVFNAIMDVGQFHPHRFKRKWWIHDWKRKYVDGDPLKGRVKWGKTNINKPVQLIDGWHFSKMCMVILVATAMITLVNPPLWGWFVGYVVCYLLWNVTFNLFYKKIL